MADKNKPRDRGTSFEEAFEFSVFRNAEGEITHVGEGLQRLAREGGFSDDEDPDVIDWMDENGVFDDLEDGEEGQSFTATGEDFHRLANELEKGPGDGQRTNATAAGGIDGGSDKTAGSRTPPQDKRRPLR